MATLPTFAADDAHTAGTATTKGRYDALQTRTNQLLAYLTTLAGETGGSWVDVTASTKTISEPSGSSFHVLGTTIAGVCTITLPDAAVSGAQVIYRIKREGAHTVTVDSAGGNVEGSSSLALGADGEAVTFVSDGTNWFIF